MKTKKSKNKPQEHKQESTGEKNKKGFPIPAGTEQETGLTRGETEKVHGPVKEIKGKEQDNESEL